MHVLSSKSDSTWSTILGGPENTSNWMNLHMTDDDAQKVKHKTNNGVDAH